MEQLDNLNDNIWKEIKHTEDLTFEKYTLSEKILSKIWDTILQIGRKYLCSTLVIGIF